MSFRVIASPAKRGEAISLRANKMAGYVYLMTNQYNTVFYTGVTSNLEKRIYEHKNGITDGFTSKYKVHKLVYYEIFDDIENAILREKKIKAGSRKRKFELILKVNPEFKDLSVAWEIASAAGAASQ